MVVSFYVVFSNNKVVRDTTSCSGTFTRRRIYNLDCSVYYGMRIGSNGQLLLLSSINTRG